MLRKCPCRETTTEKLVLGDATLLVASVLVAVHQPKSTHSYVGASEGGKHDHILVGMVSAVRHAG